MREQSARGAEQIASYVNQVFRRALVERERINSRDLPHEIFHIGTSHTRERRLPGEIGYEPAGIFTPDLREVDTRYNELLQVVSHTRQERRDPVPPAHGSATTSRSTWPTHGTGNGGLLLTDFGWVAVTPGRAARLVEVGPLFVRLAHEAAAG
jgi:hypothetical protein